ncbi:MAG: Stp1/IreP family PP2C-type Ser/Thr phosphatase [Nitrospirae bacterium]|nr:Stp1/IreP family PP2C-type Ser/Thr phosphatase [Nitrospirota bacterium]
MIVASKTDTGKVRTNNEDSILVDQERGIFLLADGMGGHNAGEVASKLAVDTVHDYLKVIIGAVESDEEILHALNAAVMKAHEAVKEKAASDINLRGMGTTLVVLVVKNKKAYLCHAGDSRAYLFRGKLKRLTKDHTVGDSYVEKGYMTREQVPPQQWHMLTQAVGTDNDLAPDKKTFGLKPGDILLLCSDGLTNMLTDDEIAAIFKNDNSSINELADSLVAEANNRGGRDNISLILVAI